ncbi:hypothetical protein BDD12DRAFT_883249 [Trichophaea hybrida]|nr:hypothetical protein BDD12DRAFT_883249 [Trichophaea hybrida]
MAEMVVCSTQILELLQHYLVLSILNDTQDQPPSDTANVISDLTELDTEDEEILKEEEEEEEEEEEDNEAEENEEDVPVSNDDMVHSVIVVALGNPKRSRS